MLVLVRLAALAFLLGSVSPVQAQRTGGRFGGGSFGSSSSRSRSLGGSRSHGSSFSGGSRSLGNSAGRSSGVSGGSGPGLTTEQRAAAEQRQQEMRQEWEAMRRRGGEVEITPAEEASIEPHRGWLLGMLMPAHVLLGLLGGLVFFLGSWRWFGGRLPRARPNAPAAETCQVRRVSLAFDWNARAELQAALAQVANSASFENPHARWDALRRTLAVLEDRLGHVRYATWQSFGETTDGADARVQRTVDSLRVRFREETITNRERREASPLRARAEEGEGMVVVSIVVGALGSLPDLPSHVAKDGCRQAFAGLVPMEYVGVATLDVVWSPSEELDRMSSAELEALYPELVRLDEGVGTLACAYCRAPFPRELAVCPGCGAPVA